MKTTIVSIPTATIPLDGAWYEPDSGTPRDLYPAEEFRKRCKAACAVEIVSDCDHFYRGCEGRISTLVSDWLRKGDAG